MTDSDPIADDAFFAAFLDTIIPPGEGMPGAGEVLCVSIRGQIQANAQMAAPVSAALSALRDAALERDPGGLVALDGAAREELLEGLLPQQPVLGMFQMFVFAGYYQNEKALQAMGLPGRPPFPGGYEVDPIDPALLAKLEARRK